MKRYASWFVVILATFWVGVFVTILWFNYKLETPEAQVEVKENLPILAICELVNNPEKYNGQKVRLSANLYWYQHGYFLVNENCPSIGEAGRVAITYDQENREKVFQQIENVQSKKFMSFGESVNMIAVGKFKKIDSKGSSFGGNIDGRTPLHFELIEIEKGYLEKREF